MSEDDGWHGRENSLCHLLTINIIDADSLFLKKSPLPVCNEDYVISTAQSLEAIFLRWG